MKKMNNNLDERQEQALSKIAEKGFWLLFWGMFASIILQFVLKCEVKSILINLAVFVLVSIYFVFRCTKAGIWDRYLKPNFLTNLIISIITGGFVSLLITYIAYTQWESTTAGIVISAVLYGGVAIVGALSLLSIFAEVYKKRVRDLENSEL